MGNKRKIRILLIVVGILVVALTYEFGYNTIVSANDELTSTKNQLKSEVNSLQVLWSEKEQHEQDIENYTQSNASIVKDIPVFIAQEDQILAANTIEEDYSLEIQSVGLGEGTVVYTLGVNYADADFQGQTLVAYPLTLNYTGTYDDLKTMLAAIKTNGNKEVIQSITMSFDEETGEITGNMILMQYALFGDTERVYVAPEINGISQGMDSVFGEVQSEEIVDDLEETNADGVLENQEDTVIDDDRPELP